MACFADVLYQVLTSEKVDYILASQSCLSKLYFELWDNKGEQQRKLLVIYKVMYTELCENTLRIEAFECINNESLDWLCCMCTSRLHKFYNFT